MAGSWKHMTTESGRLRNNESFVNMIENLGDAYEAAEECFGMVWWLANELARSDISNGPGTPARERVLAMIEDAREQYKDGLRIGGVSRPR